MMKVSPGTGALPSAGFDVADPSPYETARDHPGTVVVE
jgi:hypothetical protein